MFKGATQIDGVPQGATLEGPDQTDAETARLARSGVKLSQKYRLARAASAPPGVVEQFLGGAKHALDRTALGVKGLVTDLSPEDRELLSMGKAFVEETGPASTVGQIAGDVAISAPVFSAAYPLVHLPRVTATLNALRKIPLAPLAGSMAGNAAYNAATTPEDRGEAAMWGAASPVVARAATGAANLFRGAKPGPQAQLLIDQGIRPTYGQVMSEKGVIGRGIAAVERSAEAIPIAGGVLRRNHERARESFQEATRKAAMPDTSDRVARTLDQISHLYSKRYNLALERVKEPVSLMKPDDLVGHVDMSEATPGLIGKARAYVEAFIPEQPTSAAQAHAIEARLKEKAWNYKKSVDPDQREFGDILHRLAKGLGDDWRNQVGKTTPKVREQIAHLDKQFQNFVSLRRAALSGEVADPENYTPKTLLKSIRAGDKSHNKGRWLHGKLPQQELATAAENVLGSRSLEPGIRETLGTMGTIASGAVFTAPTIAAVTGAAVYSNPTFQRYLVGEGLVQKAFENWFDSLSPKNKQQFLMTLTQAVRATQGGADVEQ